MPMKTLLAVLHLSLVSQVPAPGSKEASPQQPEKKRVLVYDFEDGDPIVSEPLAPEGECFFAPRDAVRESLLRLRESFDEKVMQSVDEL
jgi:hypothetical protein